VEAVIFSQTRTAVRECRMATKQVNGKGQDSTPIAMLKPLNRSSPKLACVNNGTQHAKFYSDRFGGFFSTSTWFLPCCWFD